MAEKPAWIRALWLVSGIECARTISPGRLFKPSPAYFFKARCHGFPVRLARTGSAMAIMGYSSGESSAGKAKYGQISPDSLLPNHGRDFKTSSLVLPTVPSHASTENGILDLTDWRYRLSCNRNFPKARSTPAVSRMSGLGMRCGIPVESDRKAKRYLRLGIPSKEIGQSKVFHSVFSTMKS